MFDPSDLNLADNLTDIYTGIGMDIDTAYDRTNIPLRVKHKTPVKVRYENALKMARDIVLDKDRSYYAIVKGSFIFGDFIEALTQAHKLSIETLYVATLGMSENNVDSLVNLIKMYDAKKINLIVSTYFFGVEKGNMIPYLIEESAGLPFDIAVAGSHAKICCIKASGLSLVMHGSANLSSNSEIEQFMLQEDEALYKYNAGILNRIMRKHTIIKGMDNQVMFDKARKSRQSNLWKTIQEE